MLKSCTECCFQNENSKPEPDETIYRILSCVIQPHWQAKLTPPLKDPLCLGPFMPKFSFFALTTVLNEEHQAHKI